MTARPLRFTVCIFSSTRIILETRRSLFANRNCDTTKQEAHSETKVGELCHSSPNPSIERCAITKPCMVTLLWLPATRKTPRLPNRGLDTRSIRRTKGKAGKEYKQFACGGMGEKINLDRREGTGYTRRTRFFPGIIIWMISPLFPKGSLQHDDCLSNC